MTTKVVNGKRVDLTQEELDAQAAQNTAHNDYLASIKWRIDRQAAYKELWAQIDMLYRDIENGTVNSTGELYTHRKSVKDAYPKPE